MSHCMQFPSQLLELYRCINGQARGTKTGDLLVPGFRFLPLEEVVDEIRNEPEWKQVLVGDYEVKPLAFDDAAEPHTMAGVEVPFTDVAGHNQFTIRFAFRRAALVSVMEGTDETRSEGSRGGLCGPSEVQVWLRGRIGEGQLQARSLAEFIAKFC